MLWWPPSGPDQKSPRKHVLKAAGGASRAQPSPPWVTIPCGCPSTSASSISRPRQRRVPEPSRRSHLRRLAEDPRRPTRKLPPSSVRPGISAERVMVSAYRMVPRLGSAGSVGGVRQMHPGGQAAEQVVKELIGNALAGADAAAAVDALDQRDVVLRRGNERVGGWPRRSSRPTMSRRPRPSLINAEPPVPVRTRPSRTKGGRAA